MRPFFHDDPCSYGSWSEPTVTKIIQQLPRRSGRLPWTRSQWAVAGACALGLNLSMLGIFALIQWGTFVGGIASPSIETYIDEEEKDACIFGNDDVGENPDNPAEPAVPRPERYIADPLPGPSPRDAETVWWTSPENHPLPEAAPPTFAAMASSNR
jgi:hypothetical protein